jgi:hypothetical protein
MQKAEERMMQTMTAGFTPMAMLWRNKDGLTDKAWRSFQRRWVRPTIIHKANTGSHRPSEPEANKGSVG